MGDRRGWLVVVPHLINQDLNDLKSQVCDNIVLVRVLLGQLRPSQPQRRTSTTTCDSLLVSNMATSKVKKENL